MNKGDAAIGRGKLMRKTLRITLVLVLSEAMLGGNTVTVREKGGNTT